MHGTGPVPLTVDRCRARFSWSTTPPLSPRRRRCCCRRAAMRSWASRAEHRLCARDIARACRPDCVALDVNLPDGDGRERGAPFRTVPRSCSSPCSTRPRSATRGQRGARLRTEGRARLAAARRTAGPAMSLRVVIAEDQALLRQGIVRLLDDAGFEASAEAADAPDLLRRSRCTGPTSRSSTCRCRRTTPTTACARRCRSARPIRASAGSGPLPVRRGALRRRPDRRRRRGLGYLLKDRVTDFTGSPTPSARGGRRSALDPPSSRTLGRRRRDDPPEGLTPRERAVLELMAEGRSNKGIAEALVVTLTPSRSMSRASSSSSAWGAAPRTIARVLAALQFIRGESAP